MMDVDARSKVLAVHPGAVVRRDNSYQFTVWDISREEQAMRNAAYGETGHWPVMRKLLGIGVTEDSAWEDAASQL